MTSPHDDSRLTAYALGELDEFERSEVEALIADDVEAQSLIAEIQSTARLLTTNLQNEAIPGLAPEHRQAIETCLEIPQPEKLVLPVKARRNWTRLAIAAGLIGVAATLLYPSIRSRFQQYPQMELALNDSATVEKLANFAPSTPVTVQSHEKGDLLDDDIERRMTPTKPGGVADQPSRYEQQPAASAPEQSAMARNQAQPQGQQDQGQPGQPGQGKSAPPGGQPGSPGGGGYVANPFVDNSTGKRSPVVVGTSAGGVGNYTNNQGIPFTQGQANPSTTGGFAGGGAGTGGAGNFGGGMGGTSGGMGQGQNQKPASGQSGQPAQKSSSSQPNNTQNFPYTQGSASNIQPFNAIPSPASNEPGQQGQQAGQKDGQKGQGQQPQQGQQAGQNQQQEKRFAKNPSAGQMKGPAENSKSKEEGFLYETRQVDSTMVVQNDGLQNGVSYPKNFKEMAENRRKMALADRPGEATPLMVGGESAKAESIEDLQKKVKELDGKIAWIKEMMPRAAMDGRVLVEAEESRRRLQEQIDRVQGGDAFARIVDNPFLPVEANPLSTFSIDVDTASYANVRRYINQNTLPPRDAVRIEELINYFPYSYSKPNGDDPFSVNLEVARCPWDSSHRLVRIGLKGREIDNSKRPLSNLVFLVDVSGSMNQPDKLPLLKAGMRLLVDQLGENDRVAIVVYAASEGLALSSTSCSQKEKIYSALEELQAGGSTNGGRGIQLAYDIAVQNFITGGTNRVILATDGDFNVGVTEGADLDNLIVKKRETGVSLSVLGFGQGNVKHDKLESLADKGNGQYSYIDTIKEARKVMIEQISGTLVTIAKDVKIQVKFNPARAVSYRLIGYENRVLQAQDFANDKKDAGEIGAGHSVTALYEVVPPPNPVQGGEVGDKEGREILNVDLRYKAPDGDVSKLISFPAIDQGKDFAAASEDYRFASSVAGFGMLLRNSPYKGSLTWTGLLEMARAATGPEPTGYRQEFLGLIGKAQGLDPR